MEFSRLLCPICWFAVPVSHPHCGYFRSMSASPDPTVHPPYQQTAEWYDAIYAARGRDCALEIERISHHWRGDGRQPESRSILDAGCGSGAHLAALAAHGRVTGVDQSTAMLEVAARRFAPQQLLQADLLDLDLEDRFDLVVSLFGVCGYLADRAQLHTALSRLGRHVLPGGTLLVEPPLLAEHFQAPRRAHVEARLGASTLSRSTESRRVGTHLELDFEWRQRFDAAAEPDRVVRECHRMLLLDSDAWLDVATAALGGRFGVHIDPEGPIGRGLLVAISRDGARGSG